MGLGGRGWEGEMFQPSKFVGHAPPLELNWRMVILANRMYRASPEYCQLDLC
jgi:hypothetical protein